MEQIRAFIAIELPQRVKDELARLEEELRAGRETFVKWVAPGGIHLTLKFLGNVAGERVHAISDAIAGVASGTSPFGLRIEGVGAFPNLRAPRVVWVGVGGDLDSLRALQKGIDRALLPLGFAIEGREFSPHLTLGRVRETASPSERHDLGSYIGSVQVKATPAVEVRSVNLMRSQLTPRGAIYSCLAALPLGKSLSTE